MKYSQILGTALVALTMLVPATSLAAVPSITRIFPAGAAAGTSVDIELAGELAPWPVELISYPEGLVFEPQADTGKVRVTVPAEAPAGVYLVRARNAEGFSPWRPFVVGRRAEIVESERNTDTDSAEELTGTSLVINGRLSGRQDVDCFAINLTAGQTLVVSALANEVLGSPMDMTIQICDQHGFVLHQVDDERNLDPQLVFLVPRDGRYLIRLVAFPADPNSSISFASGDNYIYRLTVTTEAFVDHYLPLAVQRGAAASLQPIGWNVPPLAVSLPEVTAGPQVLAHAPELAEASWLPVYDATCLVADESAGPETPQDIPLPCIISGQLEAPGDVDSFQFTATEKQRIQFDVASRELGFPLDAVLTIHDASGKKLSEVDDLRNRRDPRIEFQAPADGVYRVSIRDLHGEGGTRYAYRIAANIPEPPFTFRSSSDAYLVARGATLEIPLEIDRPRRFEEVIEFSAEGLPEGCEFTAPPSEKEGDSAGKVTAKLTANCEPGIYRIRLLATSSSATTPVPATFRVAGVELDQVSIHVTPVDAPEAEEPEETPAE